MKAMSEKGGAAAAVTTLTAKAKLGNQDGRGVPMPGAVLLGGFHEPLRLSLLRIPNAVKVAEHRPQVVAALPSEECRSSCTVIANPLLFYQS
jgi:hypothetical protein